MNLLYMYVHAVKNIINSQFVDVFRATQLLDFKCNACKAPYFPNVPHTAIVLDAEISWGEAIEWNK